MFIMSFDNYIPSTCLSYNWRFVPFDYFYPVPLYTTRVLAATNLIYFSMNVFAFEI